MTTTSHKDLFASLRVWTTSQQTALDTQSTLLHRIITALPDGNEPGVASNLPTPYNGRPFVIHPLQNGECTEKQTPCTPPVSILEIRRDRPVLTAAIQQPDLAKTEPSAKPTAEVKPKKIRAKHASEADIRKAVKLVYDEDLTQKEAEIVCNLPPGTLSRRKGKQIMDGYRKAWGTPTTVKGQRGARRKDVENANKYENR